MTDKISIVKTLGELSASEFDCWECQKQGEWWVFDGRVSCTACLPKTIAKLIEEGKI